MAKRGKLEIMRDVLRIIHDNKNSIKPTPLLRKSQMSSSRFKELYFELLEKEFIIELIDSRQDKYVSLTEKGFKFLERYRTIVDFIQEFDL
jgi:predicted transcriptional regulator